MSDLNILQYMIIKQIGEVEIFQNQPQIPMSIAKSGGNV